MSKKTMRIPKKLMGKKLEGEWVFLNLENGTYYGLNKTGSVIWDELKEKKNSEAAVGRLQVEYRLDRAQAEKDVKSFLKDLRQEGLVRIEDASQKA